MMEVNKLAYIHHRLTQWVERFPRFIDSSILKERDRFCAYFDSDYFQKRSTNYILRLLLTQHLQRKKLIGNHVLSSKNRSLEFRIFPGKVHYPFGSKQILGVLVQISLTNRYELFDEEIFQRGVHRLLPNLHIVKGTIYKFQGNNENIRTWYAEFEKTGNQEFTLSELSLLKESLGKELLERTEQLVPAVFKVRNQEEVLRNILTLSQEIDQVEDIPQVMISFETQSPEEIIFTSIIVRGEDQLSISLENLFQNEPSSCRWILERKQLVRYLDSHQPIIAYLFSVLLVPDSSILRSDGSLNFFAARQKIAASLKTQIGEYRDFNGGILIKQEEALLGLRNAFPQLSAEQIENIFYSITPIEMQTILPASTLQAIIDLTAQSSQLSLNDMHDYHLVSSSKPPFIMVLLHIPHGPLYEKAKEHLQLVEFPEDIQASFSLSTKKSHIFGYLISITNKKFSDRFVDSLSNLLFYWANEVKHLKILRLSLNLNNPISSLDPRIGGDAISSSFLKMLFEGLMRFDAQGKVDHAIAEKVDISEDQLTYHFHLRETFWSNGDPLTSQDFEYAWKKILSPSFKSPYNYFLFCIKNAEKAKKGLVPMHEVGIQSINDRLLKVELSSYSPHFLETLALPIFSPVHRMHDTNSPNWPVEDGNRYICNGAFKIEKKLNDNGLVLIKNGLYWDYKAIHLDKVIVVPSHSSQSLELFAQNQIHWFGFPFENFYNISNPKLGPQDSLITYPDNGLYWAVCQTEHILLKNKKIRQALSLAIDRQALLDLLRYPQDPAFSPLPPIHSQIKEDPYPFSPELARKLWQEGLKELNLFQDNLPQLEILFTLNTFFAKQTAEFLHHSWKKILGISCRIQGIDFKALFHKFGTKDFHIGLIRWLPWVNDPFYTLNAFINHESPFSLASSFNANVIELIKSAQTSLDEKKRIDSVKLIEERLIDELPIIPLFNTYFKALKKKNLRITPNHTLIDFKWAQLDNPS